MQVTVRILPCVTLTSLFTMTSPLCSLIML